MHHMASHGKLGSLHMDDLTMTLTHVVVWVELSRLSLPHLLLLLIMLLQRMPFIPFSSCCWAALCRLWRHFGD